MARISDSATHLALRPYYQTICESASAGLHNSLNDPSGVIFCPRTSACTVSDHILAELTNRLDGFVKPLDDKKRNIRFLKFGKRRTILLWVKKVNSRRLYSTVKTAVEDRTAHAEMFAAGQIDLLPTAVILTVGYLLNSDGTKIRKISITPTYRRGSKPSWWIDLAMIPVVGIGEVRTTTANQFRIDIRRSSQQRKLG